MTLLEADYKRKIVADMKEAGGYGRRIEDQFAVGVPDLLLSLRETGIILAEVKRFTGNFFKPSPRQYVEMERINHAGGVTVLVGVKMGRYYLHHSAMSAFVENCVVQRDDETFPQLLIRWFKEDQKCQTKITERQQTTS